MGDLYAWGPYVEGFVLLFSFLVTMALILLTLLLYRQKRRGHAVFAALLTAAAYLVSQILLCRPFPLHVFPAAAALTALAATAVCGLVRVGRYRREHLVPASVKESIDSLPMGVCCYWPGGLAELVNERMDSLSFSLTGSALLNGETFWERLSRGEGLDAEIVQTGENPVVRLRDGTVRSFFRFSLPMDGGTLYEILAADMTEEYDLNAQLVDKRARVEDFNRRMRKLSGEIDRMVAEKEVLSVKVRIHDDLSRVLLLAKHYYLEPGAGEKEALLHTWNRTLRLLQGDGPEVWRDGMEYALRTAEEFGVRLDIRGALPEDPQVRELLSSALITCLSNAVRHAGADRMTAVLTCRNGVWHGSITNNGADPEGKVNETGGLKNLRRQIEAGGGVMNTVSYPHFALLLTIPERPEKEASYGV